MLGSGLVIGRRGAFHNAMYAWHLSSAAVLVAGIALIALTGDRKALRASVDEFRRLSRADRDWLATLPARLRTHAPEPPTGRFNAGQKLNFGVITLLLGVLFASGLEVVLAGRHHNLIFGVHKLATIAAAVLVGGHLYMALVNPATRPALRGMLTGQVDREWARVHHALWTPDKPSGYRGAGSPPPAK
jgi:formate dehydrogenase subunit gamma